MNVELAWAAGFYDGEGCTTFQVRRGARRDYGYVHVTINQSGSPETLERFRAAVGMGRIRGPYHAKTKTFARPYWQYGISHAGAWDVLRKLSPYLSSPKQAQALRCLRRAQAQTYGRVLPKGPSRKTHCKQGHDLSETRYIRPDGLSNGCGECVRLRKTRAAA